MLLKMNCVFCLSALRTNISELYKGASSCFYAVGFGKSAILVLTREFPPESMKQSPNTVAHFVEVNERFLYCLAECLRSFAVAD